MKKTKKGDHSGSRLRYPVSPGDKSSAKGNAADRRQTDDPIHRGRGRTERDRRDLIITNCYKSCIENHFDVSFELEKKLEASGDLDHLQMVQAIASMANVYSVRQKNPRGLGHAVLCARSFVGDEPFAILLGDDIVVNRNGKTATQQLVDVYHETGDSVVGVQRVAPEVVHKYGIIDPKEQLSERLSQVRRFVEKPSREVAPSNFAILGRYVLTPAIFDLLETQAPGKGNEIQLTDAYRPPEQTGSGLRL